MKHLFLLTSIISNLFIYSCRQKQEVNISVLPATSIDTAQSSCPFVTKDDKNNIAISWVRTKDPTTSIVCYAISNDGGKTFGSAVEIPSSVNVHPHAENLPKMVFKPSGEIIIGWGAANPNPKNAYAGLVYYAQSFDGGKSWSNAIPLVKDPSGIDQRYFDLALLPNGEAAF